MTTGILVLCIVILAVALVGPVLAYLLWSRRLERGLDQFAEKVNAQMEAPAKLLEVRAYYTEMMEMLQAAYDDARRRKDREALHRAQRMRERLEVLKSRVLDKTALLLEKEAGGRRRRKK